MVHQVIMIKDGQISKNYRNEKRVPAAEPVSYTHLMQPLYTTLKVNNEIELCEVSDPDCKQLIINFQSGI